MILRYVSVRDGLQRMRRFGGRVRGEAVPDLEEVFGKDLFWKWVAVDPDPLPYGA